MNDIAPKIHGQLREIVGSTGMVSYDDRLYQVIFGGVRQCTFMANYIARMWREHEKLG